MKKTNQLLLQSFNVFETEPSEIFDFLIDCKSLPIPEKEINNSLNPQKFQHVLHNESSMESVQESLAASFGLEGEYLFYSGSMQTEFKQDHSQTTTSYQSLEEVRLDCGTTTLNVNEDNILAMLSQEFQDDLNAIDSYKKAKNFIENWGTHLILGLHMGGVMNIIVQADTKTISKKREIDQKVSAQYKNVADISATAAAAQSLSSQIQGENFSQSIKTIGGDLQYSSSLSVEKPDTFVDWATSCTKDSVCGMSKSIEIWKLAKAESQTFLKEYIQYALLVHSINNPRIFSDTGDIKTDPFQMSCGAESINGLDYAGYKIISGGSIATVLGNHYLYGSYPQSTFNKKKSNKIHNWIGETTGRGGNYAPVPLTLTEYAIAIYDPNDFLEVQIIEKEGKCNTEEGPIAKLDEGFALVGGGCKVRAEDGTYAFLISSYPDSDRTWKAMGHDYQTPAQNPKVYSYAIGVKAKDPNMLTIATEVVSGSPRTANHGDNEVDIAGKISGGGVKVVYAGYGNLVQSSYPSAPDTWKENNKDTLSQGSPVEASAFAIAISAEMKT